MKKIFALFSVLFLALLLMNCGNAVSAEPTVYPEPEPPTPADPVASFHLYQEHMTVPTRIHVTGSYIGTLESYVVDGVTYRDDFSHYLTTPGIYQVTMTVTRNEITTTYTESFEVGWPEMTEGDYIIQDGLFTGFVSLNAYRVSSNISNGNTMGDQGNIGYFSMNHGILEFTTLRNNRNAVYVALPVGDLEGSYFNFDNNYGFYNHLGANGYTEHQFPIGQYKGQFVDWFGDGNLEIITVNSGGLTVYPLEGAAVREDLSQTLVSLNTGFLAEEFQILPSGNDMLLLAGGEYYSKDLNQKTDSGLTGVNFVAGQFDSDPNDYEWFYYDYDGLGHIASLDGSESVTVLQDEFKYKDHLDVNNDQIDDILLYQYTNSEGGFRGFLLLMSTAEGYKEIPINFYNRNWYGRSGALLKQEGQDAFYILAELTDSTDNTIKRYQVFELDR